MSKVAAVCISEHKGTKKHPVERITVKENHGIVGDAHAGNWHRQISLLAQESVDEMRQTGLTLHAGDFAENILTEGIDLKHLPVGTVLRVGKTRLQVTQIGKECHNDCEIRRLTGKCVMPTDGIFAVVLNEGVIRPGDKIEVEREVQTVISAKKMEQKIMNVIPVFIILYLNLTSGEFLAPLYGNIFGISVMTGALGAYLAAIKISAKMTAIKV